MKFGRRPLNPSPINSAIRRRPFLFFGLPFILSIIGATQLLTVITQTKYDLNDEKHKKISKEEQLKLRKDRKPVDIREEYFRLSAGGDTGNDDWENKRVPRLPGQAEWGELPPNSKQ